MKQHTLIVVEGISGIGKDTFAEHLVYRLQQDLPINVVLAKEPTDGFYGERGLLRLSKGMNDLETVLLMLMDRHVHIINLKKSIEPGSIIVMNRYGLSTMAYQLPEFHSIIVETHKLFPTPNLSIVMDADYQRWMECNREWFISHGSGDRGAYRKKLRDKSRYYELREKYLSNLEGNRTSHINGKTIIIDAFKDIDDMVDGVMPLVLKAIKREFVPLANIASRNAARIAMEKSVKGVDGASNKQVMEEAEKCIQYLLNQSGTFTSKQVIDSLRELPVNKIIGNVIQQLTAKQVICKLEGVDDNIYRKGQTFKEWHPGT